MLPYLIKITDNTFAVTIVLSFWLLIALRNPLSKKGPSLWFGVALGAGAAIIFAILKRNTGWAVREYYDLGVIIPTIVLALMALPMIRRSFAAKPGFLRKLLAVGLPALWLAYCLPNIILYPLDFAVGMETIFNADFLYKVVGYVAGLFLMVLLGWSISKITRHLPWHLAATAVFLATSVFALQQALQAAQILVGRGLIPQSDWLMNLVIAMLNHANWFMYALIGLVALMSLTLIIKVRLTALTGANPAQIRKMKAAHRSQTRYCMCALACLLIVLPTITAGRAYANREVEISPPLEISAENDRISIPLEKVNDGSLHRYVYKTESGVMVRFIIIRKGETAYGVGLDACDICGPSGYYQRKDQVICKLCDVVMNKSTIGFPGGCNPVPLKFSVGEGNLYIKAADLDAEEKRFQ